MSRKSLSIGAAAKLTGLSPKTIRFYEQAGLLEAPARTESGYRVYSDADLARLRLIRRVRLLGLGLPAVRDLVEAAFSSDCRSFGERMFETLAAQREAVDRRIQELETLRAELGALESHVAHCCEGYDPRQNAADCGYCGLIVQQEGGEMT